MRARTAALSASCAVAAAGAALVGYGLVGGADPVAATPSPAPPSSAARPAEPVSPPSAGDRPAPTRPAGADGGIAGLADPAWVLELAGRTGIPSRALAAYAGAAMRLAEEEPGCGVDWATLAGIGLVESVHGTIDGGALDEDGRASPPVIGIALDGTRSARIADTDGGALDGDDVWDRAVGPMQFIPTTWLLYGADGDGDGIPDPQQIDDAALAAARYLCAAGGDLTSPAGWIAAVGAYNDDAGYNNLVADATSSYRRAGAGSE